MLVPRPSWVPLLLGVLRTALVVGTAAILLVTAVPAIPTDQWLVRYLGYPALQVMVLAAFSALALLLLPVGGWPGSRRLTWGAASLLLLACTWQGCRLYPYILPPLLDMPAPTVAAGSCSADQRVRVFEANVQMTNQHDDRLLEMVRRTDPDIAWFQETDAWWEGELAPLSTLLPHGVAQAQANYFGVHLFSKLPLEDVQVQNLTNSRNPSVSATVTLPSGRRLRIHAIHPRPPQMGQSTAERDAQLIASALEARRDTLPHIMVGDLNTVPWEAALHQTEAVAGVADPRVGRGLFITWNAKRIFAKWPLDHVLTGAGITLAGLDVLPPFGSDHQPLLADLCIPLEAVPLPTLDAPTLARLRATVARGQGKAVQPDAATSSGTEPDRAKSRKP